MGQSGGPVLIARTGEASARRRAATAAAASPGRPIRLKARRPQRWLDAAPGNRRHLSRYGFQNISAAGRMVNDATRLSRPATITPVAADSSSAPGARKSPAIMATASTTPANRTVRPAVARAIAAASAGAAPCSCSRLKRATVRSE